jgi:hypothetical protein
VPDDADETQRGFAPPPTGLSQPAPTTPIGVTPDTPGRVTARAPRASAFALAFVAVAAASFLLGVGLATATHPAEEDVEIAHQRVGPSGGTVRFAGGEIHIPDGALSEELTIVVSRTRAAGPTDTSSYTYRFGPADVTFLEPVELTFSLPHRALNAVVFVLEDGSVEPLPARLDADRGTATTAVRDFRFEAGGP